ncbi:MAG: C1 family peptidase [Acidimicrobiales bacterium]
MEATLTPEGLKLLRKEFSANPGNRLAQNAVTRVSVDDVALNREVVNRTDHSFSNLIDDWKVTNQEHSGRCWLFAGLNLLRAGTMAKLGVKDFEFSQNYAMFWDKLERANYFLEAVISTAARDIDDRTVAYLLDSAANDGGQWNMFVAIVNKHGLVPKAFMPETQSSSNTARMNSVLRSVLRQGAKSLRHCFREVAARAGGTGHMDGTADDQAVAEARAEKAEILNVVHRVLSIHLGTPPEQFMWQWADKDRKFHRDGMMTPQQFAAAYVELPLDDYVCLVHDPRPSSPVGRTFTVEYLGNVLGAPPVTYLNIDMGLMKQVASQVLQAGEPVWFGCDVGKMMSNDFGLWDARLFDYSSVYDTAFTLGKADRLIHHETQMTHAMLFTGVDIVDGHPRHWRVENSWGKDRGVDGFYTMNDSWFDEYLFEIAARSELLPAELTAALDEEPIVLPAWDPMGALAR